MTPSHALRVLTLAACLVTPAAAAVPAAHAAPEGTMTWGLHVTLAARWLDPAETEAIITPFMILYALHDALVKSMPSGLNAPSLAESWTASKDGLTYEFVLRRGPKFHNGDPVTAEDVKFSFDRYRGAASTLFRQKVKEAQVAAPNRVRFVLREPWPDFMTFYGTAASGAGWIVPKKYVERVGDDGFKKAPVGAGPYKVVSFTPGVELVAEEIRRTSGLRLVGPLVGIFWLEFPDQWDAKSPWHDRRVRLAASLAMDRPAINQAETLGLSRLTGSIIPRDFEFALPIDPPPYDAVKAKALLAEAGYPNGFDAGDFYPFPPYNSMGEAIASYLQAVGIRTRIKTMERAAFLSAWREKKLHGVILSITGALGNAATRVEAYVTRTSTYAYGTIPEVDDLFQRQSKEVDRKKREALLHQVQRILQERVVHAPIYQLAFLTGVGPRVEEAGLGLIPGFAYTAPYEDLRLKPGAK